MPVEGNQRGAHLPDGPRMERDAAGAATVEVARNQVHRCAGSPMAPTSANAVQRQCVLTDLAEDHLAQPGPG